jgi:hypothetical protein
MCIVLLDRASIPLLEVTTMATRTATSVKRKRSGKRLEVHACRGLTLLQSWMRSSELTTAQFARRLDRSWPYTDHLLRGHARPSIDDAFRLRELAGIPLDAWKVERAKSAA